MIRVLIVDDSAFVRKTLQEELSKHDDIDVVGTAGDPYIARDKIAASRPDVLTLDLEMPRMDGLTFLARLMKYYPIPVVVVSSLAPENSAAALKAFELGAAEVISKPGSQYSVPTDPGELARAVRAAACSQISRRPDPSKHCSLPDKTTFANLETTHKVLAIGASAGGTQAIEVVLR
jgi:two-component system chemotaxis response regulator CheB